MNRKIWVLVWVCFSVSFLTISISTQAYQTRMKDLRSSRECYIDQSEPDQCRASPSYLKISGIAGAVCIGYVGFYLYSTFPLDFAKVELTLTFFNKTALKEKVVIGIYDCIDSWYDIEMQTWNNPVPINSKLGEITLTPDNFSQHHSTFRSFDLSEIITEYEYHIIMAFITSANVLIELRIPNIIITIVHLLWPFYLIIVAVLSVVFFIRIYLKIR